MRTARLSQHFEIDEGHENWPAIRAWVARHQASDVIETKFTPDEVATARWLELVPAWQHRYPEPKENFQYRRTTYDDSNYCDACGVGLRQQAPFSIAGEPRWGKNSILQLNWIFDQFFGQTGGVRGHLSIHSESNESWCSALTASHSEQSSNSSLPKRSTYRPKDWRASPVRAAPRPSTSPFQGGHFRRSKPNLQGVWCARGSTSVAGR